MQGQILRPDAKVIMNKCHWCNQEMPKGQWRNGFWVCHTCFPPEGGLTQIRKCDACGCRNKLGGVVNGKYICSECNVFLGATRPINNHGKKKKKKVQPPCLKAGEQTVEKKNKKRKGKRITRYIVVITEISYGEL